MRSSSAGGERRKPLRDHAAVREFIAAGKQFCGLFEGPVPGREAWCRAALTALSRIYAAASALPDPEWDRELDRWENPHRLSVRDRERITSVAAVVLGDEREYWVWLDPLDPPGPDAELENGDLVEDLAELYREIKPGLVALARNGARFLPRIVSAWKYPAFESSWGIVALNAMRALHGLVYGGLLED